MERAFSLTDEEFSRIWSMASALYGKGKGLEEALREATRLYTLDLPELMRRPGGLKVARQGEAEMRLTPRKGDPRAYTLVITTPGEVPEESAEVVKPAGIGPALTLIRGDRD